MEQNTEGNQSLIRSFWNHLREYKQIADERYGYVSRYVQFLCVGATGMVWDLSIFYVLISTRTASDAIARALAIVTAMTWNFFLNRYVTFQEHREDPLLKQYAKFCTSSTLGAVLNWLVSISMFAVLSGGILEKLLGAFVGIIAGSVSNFLLSRFWVFPISERS